MLLFLMVVRLVAQGNLFLAELLEQFAVRSLSARRAGQHGVVLEDPAHVVEQLGGGQKRIGTVVVVEVVQKELPVLVSLCRRPTELAV